MDYLDGVIMLFLHFQPPTHWLRASLHSIQFGEGSNVQLWRGAANRARTDAADLGSDWTPDPLELTGEELTCLDLPGLDLRN